MSAEPMRTPPRLIVESERPCTTYVPLSVTVIQSPCRHAPGNVSKYASCSRDPSGSFHNATGMDGIGAASTISPTSPTTGLPSGDQASIRTPRYGACISPAYTGNIGLVPMNALQTSVPPQSEPSSRSRLMASYTQCQVDPGSGDPVLVIARRVDRSCRSPGRMPAFSHSVRYAAPVPNRVACWSAQMPNIASAAG